MGNARRTLVSPQDDVESAIVAAFATAQAPVRVAMFAFTSQPILTALLTAAARLHDVALVLDFSQSVGVAEQRVITQLAAASVPFVLTTSPVGGAIMHHKFAVLGSTVLAGSYNWSHTARIEANHLDIETNSKRAQQFLGAWQQLWDWAKAHPHPLPTPAAPAVNGAGVEQET